MRKLITAFFTLFSLWVKAQDDDYAGGNYLRYEDQVFHENIKTIMLHPAGLEQGFPLIRLNDPELMILEFDYLGEESPSYWYTLIHCDASWNPTNMSPSEYLDGYTEEAIANYRTSFSTYQHYVHYRLEFPTQVMRPKRSGNYLLKVFPEGDPDHPVFTRRMMILDEKISAQMRVHQASSIEERLSKQEVDFTIDGGDYRIADPYRELIVVILQNNRWDNAVSGLKPVFVNGNRLDYEYDNENTFFGGREFRYFESRNLQNLQAGRVNYKESDTDKLTHIHLLTEEKRTDRRYEIEQDINGSYVIRCVPCNDPGLDADYVWVHFYLRSENPAGAGDVYVWGKFSDFKCLQEYKMRFDKNLPGYTGKAFLKQGYYNYHYMFLPFGKQIPEETQLEGTRWETENDYTILIYHQPTGVFFDQLIGYTRVKSNNSR
jgi:hypothetical protein